MTGDSTRAEPSSVDALAMRQWIDDQLSPWTRARHVALLLVAGAATVVLVSLWATETGLPTRTHLAFAVMTAIGLAWSVFATWALGQRRVLYARQRVIAASMAVSFTALFAAASAGAAAITRSPPALLAMLIGMLLLGAAVALLRHAQARHRELLTRRAELEREVGTGPN